MGGVDASLAMSVSSRSSLAAGEGSRSSLAAGKASRSSLAAGTQVYSPVGRTGQALLQGRAAAARVKAHDEMDNQLPRDM